MPVTSRLPLHPAIRIRILGEIEYSESGITAFGHGPLLSSVCPVGTYGNTMHVRAYVGIIYPRTWRLQPQNVCT